MKKRNAYKNTYRTEEQDEIRRFVIILAVVVVIVFGVYLFTKYVVKAVNINKPDAVTTGEIDYTKVTVGTMLGKTDSTYYVLAYNFDSEASDALYSNYLSIYSNKTNSLPIYSLDLSNKLNEKYVVAGDGQSNPSAKSIDELAIKDATLIKVKNGKINKYIEGEEAIKTELGI